MSFAKKKHREGGMQLSIISFTKKGWELSQKIAVSIEKATTCRVYTKCSALRGTAAEAGTEYVEESGSLGP